MKYVSIRIEEGAAEALNNKVAETGMTKSQVIIEGCKGLKDEGERLLEQLDKQSDEIQMEEIDTSDWVRGIAPECCCDFVYYRFDPKYKCEHWRKVKWVDRNGKPHINWHNSLINKFDFADDWGVAMEEYN